MKQKDDGIAVAQRGEDRLVSLYALYRKEISKFKKLTKEEEYDLWRSGCDDRNSILIGSSLCSVIYIARRYMRPGVELLDLIQEGNIGLIKALNSYQPSGIAQFSTYAASSIKWEICRFLRERKMIAVSAGTWAFRNKIIRTMRSLSSALGRNATIPEVADALAVSAHKVERTLLDTQIVLEYLDDDNSDKDDRKRHEVLADKASLLPDEDIEIREEPKIEAQRALQRASERMNYLLTGLSSCPDLDRKIFCMRYGFNDDSYVPKSVADIAEILKIKRLAAKRAIMRVWEIVEKKKIKMRKIEELDALLCMEMRRVREFEQIAGQELNIQV